MCGAEMKFDKCSFRIVEGTDKLMNQESMRPPKRQLILIFVLSNLIISYSLHRIWTKFCLGLQFLNILKHIERCFNYYVHNITIWLLVDGILRFEDEFQKKTLWVSEAGRSELIRVGILKVGLPGAELIKKAASQGFSSTF